MCLYVMGSDSVPSSHPITTEVNDPNEINEIFDDITYTKVSHPVFQLQNYVSSLIINLLSKIKGCLIN